MNHVTLNKFKNEYKLFVIGFLFFSIIYIFFRGKLANYIKLHCYTVFLYQPWFQRSFCFQNKQSELHSVFHWKFSIVFEMSCVTNPVLISSQRPQISSVYLLPKRVSTSYGLLKYRTLQYEAKDSSLVFSPLVKALGVTQRRFPVVAALAADADDGEIEISNGLELHTSYLIL